MRVIQRYSYRCRKLLRCVSDHNFVRQYGLAVRRTIRNIVVSGAFTIYQLAHLVAHELPKILELSYRKSNVIVIYGLLHLFVSDPHIDKSDAKQLMKDTTASVRKISEDRFVVVSTTPCNRQYEELILPMLKNVIRITNDIDNGQVFRVNVNNQNHRIGGNGLHNSMRLNKDDLLLVPPR